MNLKFKNWMISEGFWNNVGTGLNQALVGGSQAIGNVMQNPYVQSVGKHGFSGTLARSFMGIEPDEEVGYNNDPRASRSGKGLFDSIFMHDSRIAQIYQKLNSLTDENAKKQLQALIKHVYNELLNDPDILKNINLANSYYKNPNYKYVPQYIQDELASAVNRKLYGTSPTPIITPPAAAPSSDAYGSGSIDVGAW